MCFRVPFERKWYFKMLQSCMNMWTFSYRMYFLSQMFTRDSRTCTIFILAWGSNWGSSGFSVIKITVVHHVRMLPAWTVVWAWRKPCINTTRRSWTHFECVSAKTSLPPYWAPWLTTPIHKISGISGVYLWLHFKCGFFFNVFCIQSTEYF